MYFSYSTKAVPIYLGQPFFMPLIVDVMLGKVLNLTRVTLTQTIADKLEATNLYNNGS